jgi:hypothetical protein
MFDDLTEDRLAPGGVEYQDGGALSADDVEEDYLSNLNNLKDDGEQEQQEGSGGGDEAARWLPLDRIIRPLPGALWFRRSAAADDVNGSGTNLPSWLHLALLPVFRETTEELRRAAQASAAAEC